MRIKLSVAAALAGTLLATCLVSGSAEAASVPVLKGYGDPGDSGILTAMLSPLAIPTSGTGTTSALPTTEPTH